MSNTKPESYDGEFAEYDDYDDYNGEPVKRRSKAARHPLVVILSFLMTAMVLVGVAAAVFIYIGQDRFDQPGPLTETVNVLIEPGSGLKQIASSLQQAGVIRDSLSFELGVRFHDKQTELKHGEYSFEPGASMASVMNQLVEGKSLLHSISLPEGLTTFHMLSRIIANEVLVGRIDTWPEEGDMLPDTYHFTRGTTRQEIVDWIVDSRNKAVAEIWENRAEELPISSPEELVTLASIVEKETGQASERAEVASVFVNRLRKGMRLQSDPTIIYGLFGGEGKPSGRPILKSDIKKETAYNTYFIKGLPPGPITNPGREALQATANPATTDFLYFVADGSGGHAFATNYDDHRKNVRNWRQIEKERKDGLDTETLTELADENASSTATETTTETPTPSTGVETVAGEGCTTDCPKPPSSVPRPAPNR